MKKFLLVLTFAAFVSCKKDKDAIVANQVNEDSTASTLDSIQIPTFQNADRNGPFEITPQNISTEKGRAIFTQNGKVLFYFDQNSNKGNIRIEGKDYALDRFDFTENNYLISGKEIKIDATNGDFKDGSGDCVQGDFPEIRVSLNSQILNLANIKVQDCPNY